ncbi:MAG: DinB family protein [Agriterribacter sp.]
MERINRDQLLQQLEPRIEQHLQEVISRFQNMKDGFLLKPAANGGWSIAQCLDHLNGYGDYYLPQIEKGLRTFRDIPSQTFKSSWLGNYFTKMMEPTTGTKKMKAFKNHIPLADLDAHAVIAKFIHQQELLLKFVQQAAKADISKIKIPISIAKWVRLNLGDTFRFIIAHNERHIQQAKRNL